MRERLIELLGSKVCEDYSPTCDEWQPHSCEKCYANNCRIGELADYLIANGVIVPPCKVGDTVWFETFAKSATVCLGIQPHKIDRVNVSFTVGAEKLVPTDIPDWIIGKIVFLTREEAEAALQKGGADK